MQKPRRWRWLQLNLLPLVGACASTPAHTPSSAPADSAPAEPAPAPSAAAPAPPAPAPAESAAAPAAAPAEPSAVPADAAIATTPAPLPQGTRVLQVGDSFAAALGIELGKLLKQSGLRTSLETKTPSYIGDWAFGPVLRKAIADYNPDLVLITLGANEVEIPVPAQRVGPVQRLIKSLGDRPCVWILPPLWKQDTGVMQVIKDNAKPCQVLDSTQLVPSLPRGPDHIHPSSEGRSIWATAVFEWLKQARDPAGPRPWSLRGGPT
ncbi:MAG TPA: SGNH/GDSL hydrolase family protein [Polyangiaceae bacterium]|nr:SGNH/GDSL hydrolase family protein [Polyangiaceae bacterium]